MQCNRAAIRKRLKMDWLPEWEVPKPLADDRSLARVSSGRIAWIAVEANSGLDHRDVLVSHARLIHECYRGRSCCICLEGKEIT